MYAAVNRSIGEDHAGHVAAGTGGRSSASGASHGGGAGGAVRVRRAPSSIHARMIPKLTRVERCLVHRHLRLDDATQPPHQQAVVASSRPDRRAAAAALEHIGVIRQRQSALPLLRVVTPEAICFDERPDLPLEVDGRLRETAACAWPVRASCGCDPDAAASKTTHGPTSRHARLFWTKNAAATRRLELLREYAGCGRSPRKRLRRKPASVRDGVDSPPRRRRAHSMNSSVAAAARRCAENQCLRPAGFVLTRIGPLHPAWIAIPSGLRRSGPRILRSLGPVSDCRRRGPRIRRPAHVTTPAT